MGGDSKKPPPLPAPTETDTTAPSELATDISKPGDEKSSYSLPEDGTPVTIRTRGHKASKSQTSLLIEYFEGGKNGTGQDRKASVRVRLTPSKKGKGDHIQVTETKGNRTASLTRRIPLEQAIASREIGLHDVEDTNSTTSYASATEESNVSRNPIDIEIDRSHRRRRPASPLIPAAESYQPGNPSEISAIPTDSFLDGTGPAGEAKRSTSPFRGESMMGAAAAGALSGAAMSELNNNNNTRARERVKISDKSKDKPEKKRRSRSRANSVSEYVEDDGRSTRRRASRGHQESNVSAVDSSVVSSHIAPSHRSADTRSVRSGASKSSINNPKLLETVEDAIRRLILPELSALKREQSKRESRRGSITSTATSVSREDLSFDHRRSSGPRSEGTRDSRRPRERRNREARHDYDDDFSLRSPSHDSINAEYQSHEVETTPKQSHHLLKAAAAGAAGATLAKGVSTGISDVSESSEKKQRDRRRRRAEHNRSRSAGRDLFQDDVHEDDDIVPTPPMPLMSDINPTELTRTSILSADSERPHSASEEQVGSGTTRDAIHTATISSGTSTPTRAKSPVNHEQHAMAMHHANVSHGDLTALPRGHRNHVEEYETDEYGHKVPVGAYHALGNGREAPEPPEFQEEDFEDRYFSRQDVPEPLRYVPYQAGARGLSPIPSVSGYTEAGSEAPLPQNSTGAPSPAKSPDRARHHMSLQSDDSVPRSMRDFDRHLAEESERFDETGSGRSVRGVGANPAFVHTPVAVESAVASLVDGSMLDQSVVTGISGYDRDVVGDPDLSYSHHKPHQTTQGSRSPDRIAADESSALEEEERRTTPGSKSVTRSQEHSEYEVDEYGRKVPRSKYRHSPTASEAAITARAVGAAAAALKAAEERKQAATAGQLAEDFQPAGVARNRSFKERTMHHGWEPRNTPTHSLDRLELEDHLELGASGVPDVRDPMPEIGYGDELHTNPSLVEERSNGESLPQDWSGRATPTQRDVQSHEPVDAKIKGFKDGLDITEAVGAAVTGAATHGRDAGRDDDDWKRTSDERKRDTLITNPYEDASPIANPELTENLLGPRGLEREFETDNPETLGPKYDEGFMSNGPRRTPDDRQAVGKAIPFHPGAVDDDLFYASKGHVRHLSGMSQGMTSPFYDAATGAGIERIENKDIVALMQHLMVRDAQRSARDTEIVALLMDAALEMRNSFREMKELVQDTGDDVIFANVENTEKLQKAINGPRPYPGAASRSLQSPSQAGTLDETALKKKNLWKRALQGLSTKGTNDLSRIEDMLIQLLGEVDVLKTQTAPAVSSSGPGQSYDNLQQERHYDRAQESEPGGETPRAHASQPGTGFSPQQLRGQSSGGNVERRLSEHRVSTVPEHEEEDEFEPVAPRAPRTGGDHSPATAQAERSGSVPLETPPRLAAVSEQQQPLSAEGTSRTDKGKKPKTRSSGGWLPKISRWSGTTASSVGKAFRTSGASKKGSKHDDFPLPSRSGSSMASFDEDGDYGRDVFGADKLHSGFSDPSLEPARDKNNATPPHQGSPRAEHMTPEDPKYKAHRNSLNLQHPQPRAGQTERFRTALESSAQEYNSPMTPRSTDWAGSATSINRLPSNTNRFSNGSSGVGPDHDYYSLSGQHSGPPRPPKEPIGSPSTHTPSRRSSRPPRLPKDGSPAHRRSLEGGHASPAGGHVSRHSEGSPRLENRNLTAALGVPSRRPSGPRAMAPRSPVEEAAREERRRKRDTFGTIASEETDTF